MWGENDPYLGVDCDVVEPPPEGAMKGKKSWPKKVLTPNPPPKL